VSERWLTYDEMAEVLHLTKESARVLARRKRWPRRPGNDGRARIGVPEEEIEARSNPPIDPGSDPPSTPPGDPESTPPNLAQEVVELRVENARLEAQIEALKAITAVDKEHAQRERQSLERAVAEAAVDRDRWARVAEELAHKPQPQPPASQPAAPPSRGWWPWRRSA